MTIIVFLVDTSCSMNQRTYAGTTFLDTAKNAVEMFMKIRSRDPNCRWDRYMLLTFEDPPMNVKAGWKESHATFMKELKNLEAYSLTTLGSALKHTFDMLNTNRMQSGIDTYGQGRCPFFLEPAVIICLTDGKKMTSLTGASNELNLPMNTACLLGSELTKEPFRWDQRLYGVVFKMAASPVQDILTYIPSDDSSIDAMCEVTGGRSYSITSQKTLMQCLESLVQKCQSGVVVSFEKLFNEQQINHNVNGLGDERHQNSPQNQPWHNCKRLIYVPRSAQRGGTVGHWPIPESYWPEVGREVLPPRTAHPVINFSCHPCDPIALDNLPFDKYELEPSPLTQYILERRQPHIVWQVFMQNSSKYSDIGHPFGYIKASTTLNAVNLFVMPYNYPVLVSLLDELIKVHKCKPTTKWRVQFETYLKSVPAYYANPLKRALSRMSLPPTLNLIPDQMDNCLSYPVVSHLKKIKNQAKLEYDRLVASVGQYPPHCPTIRVVTSSRSNNTRPSLLQRSDAKQLLAHYSGNMYGLKQELLNGVHGNGHYGNGGGGGGGIGGGGGGVDNFEVFNLHANTKNVDAHIYTNPYDIHREDLLLNLSKMRLNFLKSYNHALSTKFQNMDAIHNSPIQEMGNYQDYLKKQPPPLREIETTPTRVHTFGNPFKVKNMMIDEADEAMPGQSPSSSSSSSRKRTLSESSSSSSSSSISLSKPNKKRGPISKCFTLRHFFSSLSSQSPSSSPPSSSSLSSSSLSSPLTYLTPSPVQFDPTKSWSNDVTMSDDELCIDLNAEDNNNNNNNKNLNNSSLLPLTSITMTSTPTLINHTKLTTTITTTTPTSNKLRKNNKHLNNNNNNNNVTNNINKKSNNNNNVIVNNSNKIVNNNNNHSDKITNGIDALIPNNNNVHDNNKNNIRNNNVNINKINNHRNSDSDDDDDVVVAAGDGNDLTDDIDYLATTNILNLLKSDKTLFSRNIKNDEFNNEIKRLTVTEVKKPGKNYANIFNLLRCLRGNTSEKRSQIDKIITEAGRFKKHVLVRKLQEYSISCVS